MRDAPGTPNRKHSMPKKTKTSSNRNAAARSSLARGSASARAVARLRRVAANAKLHEMVTIDEADLREVLYLAANPSAHRRG